jgi:hypothetical protein
MTGEDDRVQPYGPDEGVHIVHIGVDALASRSIGLAMARQIQCKDTPAGDATQLGRPI